MTITGRIENILDPETRGNYSSRKMWVQETGEFSNFYEVVTASKKETLFDNLAIGQTVTLSYNLKGRKWTRPADGKEMVFTTIEIWKVETNSGTVTPPTTQSGTFNHNEITPDNNSQDMPF